MSENEMEVPGVSGNDKKFEVKEAVEGAAALPAEGRTARENEKETRRRKKKVLSEENKKLFCSLVAVGCTRRTAMHRIGCSYRVVANTVLRDEGFRDRVLRAETNRDVRHLSNIVEAGKKQWRASAWLLERLHPDEFARREPNTLTATEAGHLLDSLVSFLMQDISLEEDRKKVLKSVKDLTGGLKRRDRKGKKPEK